MKRFVVAGAGCVGRAVAYRLADLHHDVTWISRSGPDNADERIRAKSLDVLDTHRLIDVMNGCDAIVNAVNPTKYYGWQKTWPPIAASFQRAAEVTGAGLVTMGNLYVYGPTSVMTEVTPMSPTSLKGQVRARMWHDLQRAHQAGRLRATEVRASDYFGPGAGSSSLLNSYVISPAISGKTVFPIMGRADQLHSWTFVPDIAELTAQICHRDYGWGRVWHVPTSEPRSIADVANHAARIAQREHVTVKTTPPWWVKMATPFVPTLRELPEMAYQFDRPFVLGSRGTQEEFDLVPTSFDRALDRTIHAGL